jgi:hypothetical protein
MVSPPGKPTSMPSPDSVVGEVSALTNSNGASLAKPNVKEGEASPTKSPKIPTYRQYGMRYARTCIDGQDFHLGVYNSIESRNKYDELVGEWLMKEAAKTSATAASPSLLEVIGLYLAHNKLEHDVHQLRPRTPAARSVAQLAVQVLADVQGAKRVSEFDSAALNSLRAEFIERGLRRREVNEAVNAIKRVFAYAVSQGMVLEACYAQLAKVKDLKRGDLGVCE